MDSLKHYGRCKVTQEAYDKLHPPVAWIAGMPDVLCLDGSYTDEQLQFKMRFVYAMFMAFNFCNHHANHACNVPQLIAEYFKQSKWKR